MFQEAFEKLDLEEAAMILDQVSDLFDEIDFDPVNTVVMAVDLSFYPGYRFLDITDHSSTVSVQRFVIYSPENRLAINFTNEPIYRLNKDVPLQLTEDNVSEYVRFFFTYVRGRHGRFLISEHVDDIAWKEDPPPAARKTIGKMLRPLTLKTDNKDPGFHMDATMVFKDSLFKSNLMVSPDGLVRLTDEELLIEDMPVVDDVFGQ